MGYSTTYNLSVKNCHTQYEDFVVWIEQKPKTTDGYSWYDFWTGDHDSCKWYGHTHDMILLSKQFPELIFTLNGEGEEPGDMWFKYYKNGKMQICKAKISYDEYDESKLEEPKK